MSLLLRSHSPALKALAPTSDPCPPLTPPGPLQGRLGAKGGSEEGLPAHSDPGWPPTHGSGGGGPAGGVCHRWCVVQTREGAPKPPAPIDPG